jgi:hypothetical protein
MTPKKTNAQLQRQIIELQAQMRHSHVSALSEINKCGDSLFSSAAVLQITGLGGRVILGPISIANGLSENTIQCIKDDIKLSMQYYNYVECK